MNEIASSRPIQSVFGFLKEWIQKRIQSLIITIMGVGDIILFTRRALNGIFEPPSRIPELFRQMEFIGNRSVLIICVTGIFTGMALSYQVYLGFKIVNATNLIGPTVALAITRELGPVLTGLIVAARAGGAIAARIGTMRVTEQIDAIEVMGVQPIPYLVSPRIVAAILMMPLLTAVFDFIAMIGSYFLCIHVFSLDAGVYLHKIQEWLMVRHINEGLFKCGTFGFFFSVICTYQGYHASGGASGVGAATNRGVVISMVTIIISDYYLTNLIRIFYQLTDM